ncbi:hypothetical protein H0H93_002677, partial [Arthromyces matolae]
MILSRSCYTNGVTNTHIAIAGLPHTGEMDLTDRAPAVPQIDLPPLPTEVWLRILEDACLAGKWNSRLDLDNLLDESSFMLEQKKLFKKSTKSLSPLKDALRKTLDSGPGYWTKRLDLEIRDLVTVEAVDLIADIIQHLPNLTIVYLNSSVFHRGFRSASTIIQSLADTSAATLQAVIWPTTYISPDFQFWAILQRLVNLKVLGRPNFGQLDGQEVKPKPVFPHLQTLESPFFPLGRSPSLRHLITDLNNALDWQPFLETHGDQLEVLTLNIEFHDSIALFSYFSTFCPNLVRVNLTVDHWHLFGSRDGAYEIVLPPRVHTLGLHYLANQARAAEYRSLFWGLRRMKISSSLRRVLLMDPRTVKALLQRHHSILLQGVEMLKKRGLELKDRNGVVIGAETLKYTCISGHSLDAYIARTAVILTFCLTLPDGLGPLSSVPQFIFHVLDVKYFEDHHHVQFVVPLQKSFSLRFVDVSPARKPCNVASRDDQVASELWFHTPALDQHIIDNLVKIQLETKSHDQGWVSVPEAGSWSWFDIVVLESPKAPDIKVKDGLALVWLSHDNKLGQKQDTKQTGAALQGDHQIFASLELIDDGWENHASEARLVLHIPDKTTTANTSQLHIVPRRPTSLPDKPRKEYIGLVDEQITS